MDRKRLRRADSSHRRILDTIVEPLHRFAITPGSGATGTAARALQIDPAHPGGGSARVVASARRPPQFPRWSGPRQAAPARRLRALTRWRARP